MCIQEIPGVSLYSEKEQMQQWISGAQVRETFAAGLMKYSIHGNVMFNYSTDSSRDSCSRSSQERN